MFRFATLSSSSAGNCTLIASEKTVLLVDAGIPRGETYSRLGACGIKPRQVTGVLLTHAHSDHAGHAEAIAADLNIPIYATEGTFHEVRWRRPTIWERIRPGHPFRVGDIEVLPFLVPHDAAEPVGFAFLHRGVRFAIATDLGYVNDPAREALVGADLVLIEANHDLDLLDAGPYPLELKKRVAGMFGHLSNVATADFVQHDLDRCTSTLLLGHISTLNNHPDLVRHAGQQAIVGRERFTKLVLASSKLGDVFVYG